tara:strand:- start:2337 stop:2531 length:195 start_codon:yes stop_codon:yes gene_type:complete
MKALKFFKEGCSFLFFGLLFLFFIVIGLIFTSTPWLISAIFDGMINCFLHDLGFLYRPACDLLD